MADILAGLLTEVVWQDVVVTVGQVVFVFALLPMVRAHHKPPISTSVVHGLVLASFGVAFASLALWFSAVTVFMVSGLWFYIGWQQYRRPASGREGG